VVRTAKGRKGEGIPYFPTLAVTAYDPALTAVDVGNLPVTCV